MTTAYARAGVDVDIEAEASRILYNASKQTFENRRGMIGEVKSAFDDFSGPKFVSVGGLPKDAVMSLGLDGAGTKVEIAQRMSTYDTIAFCLFAMLVDDAAIRGGEPALIGSVLDIRTLGTTDRFLPIIEELAKGYVAAAKAAQVSVINGEIAQMGALVAGWDPFPFNWSGACVWFGRRSRMLSGKAIRPGDSIVMLREPGFRANGMSLARRYFQHAYGQYWHEQSFLGATLGELVLSPCIIYAPLLVRLHGGYHQEPRCPIHGAAHITGGGIPEKLGRLLRVTGLCAILPDLWEPGDVLRHCQEVGAGAVDDCDMYKSTCMGQGMAIITPEPDLAIAEAVAMGYMAKNSGKITADGGIRLVSRGLTNYGNWLTF